MSYSRTYKPQLDYMEEYKNASNASTGSRKDPNANVEYKNIATLQAELGKDQLIGINRALMYNKLCDMYGSYIAEEYLRQLETHEIYKHDETSIMPYCVSITMYPFLTKGVESLGGSSSAPKHLESFCGSFISLLFAIASQFAGAVSTPEFLTYLDYFIRKEYGERYYSEIHKVVNHRNAPQTLGDVIDNVFQHIVYSLNEPAGSRNFQSIFWNIAYFDKHYFASVFEDFVFPDGTVPQWESVSWLQKRFMQWFNAERTKRTLTFPVETVNLLHDNNGILDADWYDFTAQMWSEGHSFFCYLSDSVDSLASCCRLRNGITDNTFSFTLGAGGVSTGAKAVITMNINRLVQNAVRDGMSLEVAARTQVRKNHKYLLAYNAIMEDNLKAGLLPVYDAGYISMEKQYLCNGINGFIEGAEFLGLEISPFNEAFIDYGTEILKPIFEENKKAKTDNIMFNTEFVPAESLGVKNAMWDKRDGYVVNRDCYNSYFYAVEDESCNIIDKFMLHGKAFTQYLDGGSALHANLSEHLTKEQYKKLILLAVETGCNYFTFNIPNTVCNSCGKIYKQKHDACPNCKSEDVDYLTRIIGYLKRVSKFSEPRQKEAKNRYYA